jgi:hypothetical protein
MRGTTFNALTQPYAAKYASQAFADRMVGRSMPAGALDPATGQLIQSGISSTTELIKAVAENEQQRQREAQQQQYDLAAQRYASQTGTSVKSTTDAQKEGQVNPGDKLPAGTTTTTTTSSTTTSGGGGGTLAPAATATPAAGSETLNTAMSTTAKVTIGLVAVGVVGGLAYLIYRSSKPRRNPEDDGTDDREEWRAPAAYRPREIDVPSKRDVRRFERIERVYELEPGGYEVEERHYPRRAR